MCAPTAAAQEAPLQLLYPRAALQEGIGGRVTVACSVLTDGAVACQVMREMPAGQGFGDAVLFMSQDWRMPMEDADGASTAGRRFMRSVEFSPGPPPSVSERQDHLEGSSWVEMPSAGDFAQHYPQEALRRGIDGAAMLDCLVNDDHRLICEVDSETPTGHGFGRAALRIAESFRMAPATRDGFATAGGRVRVPIRFDVR